MPPNMPPLERRCPLRQTPETAQHQPVGSVSAGVVRCRQIRNTPLQNSAAQKSDGTHGLDGAASNFCHPPPGWSVAAGRLLTVGDAVLRCACCLCCVRAHMREGGLCITRAEGCWGVPFRGVPLATAATFATGGQQLPCATPCECCESCERAASLWREHVGGQ